jgi:hypothetical protein
MLTLRPFLLTLAFLPSSVGATPPLFHDAFDKGFAQWRVLDPRTWKVVPHDGGEGVEIVTRESEYAPPHRSPLHVALVKDLQVADFEMTFRVRSTLDTGPHRDCCVFFGYQDDAHFYYAHLGALPDPNSGQIMVVDKADRRPLTQNTKPVPWDDQWHSVRLVRDTRDGRIAVYFDDAPEPLMEAFDKTFGAGAVGIGSFDDCNVFDDVEVRGLGE